MSTITLATPEELRSARAELLGHSGPSEAELRAGSLDYTLTLEQITVLDEIDRIDFLLGN